MRGGIEKEVLRLDVPVADAQAVDVCQGSGELVDVELDVEEGHRLLGLLVLPGHGVDGLGDVLQDEVQVELFGLLPVGIEALLEQDYVGVRQLHQLLHDLQLPILESFILEHLLDRHNFPRLQLRRLKDYPERSMSYNPLRRVRNRLLLPSPSSPSSSGSTATAGAAAGGSGTERGGIVPYAAVGWGLAASHSTAAM